MRQAAYHTHLLCSAGWSWNGVREKHCYLTGAGGWSWNDVRKKYCRAGAPAEQPNTVIVTEQQIRINE